jgi:VanZ family protein
MPAVGAAPRHLSSAVPLVAVFIGLVVYASLYPFSGWRWPGGASFTELLLLPMPRERLRFDIWANFIGYMPMGGLLYVAGVRSQVRPWPAWCLALGVPAGLSYAMEVTQQFLPFRVPSLLDWELNAGGGVLGATLAAVLHRLSLIDRWQRVRDRWFVRRSGGTLALLALWPFGLLFPAPFAFGMGLGWERVQAAMNEVLLGVPWAADVLALVNDTPVRTGRYPALLEGLGIVLGLLGPTLLAFSVIPRGWRRVVWVVCLSALGLAATSLSITLSFGPSHAGAWITPAVVPAVSLALGLALWCSLAGQRLVATLGVAVLSALVMLVAQAPADPYFAQSLQAWEQGRFIRFHGLAQWLGWLWPYLAIGALLRRAAQGWR